MCKYVHLIYRCGHDAFLAGPNCFHVFEQLSRVDKDPSAWDAAGLQTLPFDWPDSCLAGTHNTITVASAMYCGLECEDDCVAAAAAPETTTIENEMNTGAGAQEGQLDNEYVDHNEPSYHISDARQVAWDFSGTGVKAGVRVDAGERVTCEGDTAPMVESGAATSTEVSSNVLYNTSNT